MRNTNQTKVIILLLSSILVSCNNNEISCASETSKNLVKQIFAENSDVNSYKYSKANITQLELLDFYNKYSELTQVRTSSIQKEIKKCECQSTVKFQLPADILDKLKSGKAQEFEVVYNIQETEEGDIYGELLFPDGFENSVATYLQLIKENQKTFAQKELQNMTEFKGNSDDYVKALKEYLIADWEKKKISKTYKGPEIGRIFIEDNELAINDIYDSFLTVYDFGGIYITETKKSNIVISITNSGGGEGGNVGIEEQYLIIKKSSGSYEIILADEQII